MCFEIQNYAQGNFPTKRYKPFWSFILISFFSFGLVGCTKQQDNKEEIVERKSTQLQLNAISNITTFQDTPVNGILTHCKSNEAIVFGFSLVYGKIACLCKEKKGTYLVYRFGSKEKIEVEYPGQPDSTSWKKFKFYRAECPATNEFGDYVKEN